MCDKNKATICANVIPMCLMFEFRGVCRKMIVFEIDYEYMFMFVICIYVCVYL